MSDNRWKAIKREDGMVELSGFPGVTHVLTGREVVGLTRELLSTQMVTYSKREELTLAYQSALGEITNKREHIEDLETELARLRYAVQSWLKEEEDWKAEEKRLRGIEKAVLEVFGPETPRRQAINFWRDFCEDDVSDLMLDPRDAIADALEAQHEH